MLPIQVRFTRGLKIYSYFKSMFPHNRKIERLLCFGFDFIPLCGNQGWKFWTQYMLQYAIRYLEGKTTYKCIMPVFLCGFGVISQGYYKQYLIWSLYTIWHYSPYFMFHCRYWWHEYSSGFAFIFFCMNTDRYHDLLSSLFFKLTGNLPHIDQCYSRKYKIKKKAHQTEQSMIAGEESWNRGGGGQQFLKGEKRGPKNGLSFFPKTVKWGGGGAQSWNISTCPPSAINICTVNL